MDIGLLNGTFDPFHKGHTNMLEAVWAAMQLDFIYLLPTNNPPHKHDRTITPHYHRYAMACLATQHLPYVHPMVVDDENLSYAFQEIQMVRLRHGGDHIYYIMGMDSFLTLEKWMWPNLIAKFVSEFVVVARPGYNKADIPNNSFYNGIWDRTRFIENECTVSSTEIRVGIHNPDSLKLVHPSVVQYIGKTELYGITKKDLIQYQLITDGDAMLERMQTPEARAAMQRSFNNGLRS